MILGGVIFIAGVAHCSGMKIDGWAFDVVRAAKRDSSVGMGRETTVCCSACSLLKILLM